MALHTVWKLKSLFLVCCYLPSSSRIFVFFRPAVSFSCSLLSLTHTLESDPAVCVISFLASVSSHSKLPDGCSNRDKSAREFHWFLGLRAFPSLFISSLPNLSFSVSFSVSHSSSQQQHTCLLLFITSVDPADAFLQLSPKSLCLLQYILDYIYLSPFHFSVQIRTVLLLTDLIFNHFLCVSLCNARKHLHNNVPETLKLLNWQLGCNQTFCGLKLYQSLQCKQFCKWAKSS